MKAKEPKKGTGWVNEGASAEGEGIVYTKFNLSVISSFHSEKDSHQLHLSIIRRTGVDYQKILSDFDAEDFEEDNRYSVGLCNHFWKVVEPCELKSSATDQP